ncbi:MAG: hypothetical protein KGS61_05875 [Verrucomicrobia bacterium]|nr:hypothetical protein [Verrucomicrobiota bacterium]
MRTPWLTDPRRRPATNRSEAAFNRADLLILLGVLGLLGSLQFAALGNSKTGGRAAVCLNNLRRMAAAWQMYAQENHEELPGNLDGGDVMTLSNSNQTWVLGWFDFRGGNAFPTNAGGSADTNTFILTQASQLAPYLSRDARPFKCPADTSLSYGVHGSPRVRSISMNSYIGNRSGPYTAGYHQFRTLGEFNRLPPAQAFVFVDEREDSINDACLQVSMDGAEPPDSSRYMWIDYPSDYHNRGANLSFADGHVETWRWRDPRTLRPHNPAQLLPLGVSSPNNPDIVRLHAAASFKEH